MAITTILAILMALVLGVVIYVLVYFGFIKLVFPDFPYYWKYKVRKKAPKDEDIEFLVEQIDKGVERNHIIKEALLTNNYTLKKAKELTYLFLEVEKSMKGGKE